MEKDTRLLIPESPMVFQRSKEASVFVDPKDDQIVKKILLLPGEWEHVFVLNALSAAGVSNVWLPLSVEEADHPFNHMVLTSQRFYSSLDRVKNPLNFELRYKIAMDVASALDSLQGMGISYYDIRADNLAMHENRGYLFDFDKSKFYDPINIGQSQTEREAFIRTMREIALDVFSDEFEYYTDDTLSINYVIPNTTLEGVVPYILGVERMTFTEVTEFIFDRTQVFD